MALIDYAAEPRTPLASLIKATSVIARARSIDEVIATVRASARSLIGCEGITVIRREGELCHYIEEDAVGPLWKGQKFPATACLSGWSMIHRQTVVVPDIAKDDRIPHELYGSTFVKAVAMVPIRGTSPLGRSAPTGRSRMSRRSGKSIRWRHWRRPQRPLSNI